MLGIIFSLIAGLSMSLQGVFNTRMSEKIGLWEANSIVQCIGFIVTIIITLIWGKGNIKNIKDVNKLYLTGGLLGVLIIFAVMYGIKKLGPTYSISVILLAQLLSAAIIDAFGLFDSQKLKFGLTKILGVALMIAGIILFKLKK